MTDHARARSEIEAETIYGEIRSAIANGEYAFNNRLPTERALAARYGVARNSVRKVLKMLDEEGIIERHVGRGTFVRKHAVLEEYTLSELLEARLLFEPGLPDLVIERMTDEVIDELENCLDRLRTAESWVEFKEAKYALHMNIVRASRNRFLISIFQQIIDSRRRAGWGRGERSSAPIFVVREAAYADNRVIIEALRSGNAKAARTAIQDYIVRTLMNVSGH